MTRIELIAFGQGRHGRYWIGPLSEEIGYSFSQVWRTAELAKGNGKHVRIARRMELEIRQLKAKEMEACCVTS